MSNTVVVIDTNILAVWLKVPGKETCNSGENLWNHERANKEIVRYTKSGAVLVLPFAAIVETGNFIGNARDYRSATELADLIAKCADNQSPWAAFEDQEKLWNKVGLTELAGTWPELAKAGVQMGDLTIRKIVDYYQRAGQHCEILSADAALKAYESPKTTIDPPRRRKSNH